MRLDKWNFHFSSMKIILNSILGFQYIEFRWCALYPRFCFVSIKLISTRSQKLTSLSISVHLLKIFKRLDKKIGSFFQVSEKSGFLQIKRSVVKGKISIKISINVKDKNRFLSKKPYWLFWFPFWELQPFKIEYCQLGLNFFWG